MLWPLLLYRCFRCHHCCCAADDPCAPIDATETALDNLNLAKKYDQGVKEYMLHSKTLYKNSDVIFERSLRRLQGLAALIDIESDVWDVWDIMIGLE